VLLTVQMISYIIAMPEVNVALVQMPRVPNIHGNMTVNVRDPDQHYTYIDMSKFIWKGGMWRRRSPAQRSAACSVTVIGLSFDMLLLFAGYTPLPAVLTALDVELEILKHLKTS